jgi:hypothetical protein
MGGCARRRRDGSEENGGFVGEIRRRDISEQAKHSIVHNEEGINHATLHPSNKSVVERKEPSAEGVVWYWQQESSSHAEYIHEVEHWQGHRDQDSCDGKAQNQDYDFAFGCVSGIVPFPSTFLLTS